MYRLPGNPIRWVCRFLSGIFCGGSRRVACHRPGPLLPSAFHILNTKVGENLYPGAHNPHISTEHLHIVCYSFDSSSRVVSWNIWIVQLESKLNTELGLHTHHPPPTTTTTTNFFSSIRQGRGLGLSTLSKYSQNNQFKKKEKCNNLRHKSKF